MLVVDQFTLFIFQVYANGIVSLIETLIVVVPTTHVGWN